MYFSADFMVQEPALHTSSGLSGHRVAVSLSEVVRMDIRGDDLSEPTPPPTLTFTKFLADIAAPAHDAEDFTAELAAVKSASEEEADQEGRVAEARHGERSHFTIQLSGTPQL